MNNIKLIIIAFTISLLMYACTPAGGEFTGTEYMPDMAHSVALEANTSNYYYYNTWDKESYIVLNDMLQRDMLPVTGTVPRGYAGVANGSNADMVDMGTSEMSIPSNGYVPYYYEDTDESRAQATAELLDNPFPITADGLARGKNLYEIFCGICHGGKADGLGYLYDTDQNPKAKYLAAPANLINEEFSAASNGRFYHAIMYGKNVMGAYRDKISYEERWQVIHYIRSLQAKAAGAAYDEDQNTYNAAFGTPMASMPSDETQAMMTDTEEHGDEHHDDDSHDGEAHTDGGEHDSDNHEH